MTSEERAILDRIAVCTKRVVQLERVAREAKKRSDDAAMTLQAAKDERAAAITELFELYGSQ